MTIKLTTQVTCFPMTCPDFENHVISGHGIAMMRHADIHEAVEAGLASTLKLDSHLFNSAKTRLMVRKNSDISESTHLLIEKIQTSFGLS